MLPFFRQKQRGLKWILWLVIVILGGGMLGLFVDTPGPITGISSAPAAQVADYVITAKEFRRYYIQLVDTYRRVYKLDQQSPELVKQLRLSERALNQLVAEYATFYESQQLGLDVTSEEIAEVIKGIPAFQQNGNFIGVDTYRNVLEANNLSVQEFEGSIRRQLAREKLRRVLTDGIFSSPDEIREEFGNRTLEVKVRYVAFDPEKLSPKKIDEQKLKDYFGEHQENYRVSEQRKIRYISIDVNTDDVEITEAQIQAQLDLVTDSNQVRARHILISAESPEEEAAANAKANRLLQQLRSGADFAQLARQHSNDTGSAASGGDLGFFGRGKMVPEFEEVAFSLKPGKLSDLVKTPFGYHILQVTSAASEGGDGRRPIAEFEARQKQADLKASEFARELADQLSQNPEMAKIADVHDLPTSESSYFGLGDPIQGLAVRSDFNQKVFDIEKGQSLDPYRASGYYLVAQLTDIKASQIPPFEDLREKVRADFRSEKGNELSRDQAFAMHSTLKAGGQFEDLAEKSRLPLVITPFFKKGVTIDDTLRFSAEVHDRAFSLKKGEYAPPIQVAKKYIVFQLVDKTVLDLEQLEQERPQLEKELTEKKRVDHFNTYLENTLDRLRQEDAITINQPLVDSMEG